MYINPTLLIFVTIALVFIPSLQEWVTSGGAAWYRPYFIWGLAVAIAYWNQRKSYGDDL